MYFCVVNSVNIILGTGIGLVSYLYIFKELIYISTFYFVVNAFNVNYVVSKKLITFFITLSIGFGSFYLLTGNVAHYGIGSIVSTSPSQSGMVYLSAFYIFFMYYIKNRKKTFLVASILSGLLVFATISRTAIFGFIAFVFIFLVLISFDMIKSKLKLSHVITLFFILIIGIVIGINSENQLLNSNNYFLNSIVKRLTNISASAEIRSRMSQNYFNLIIGDSTIKFLFGLGKSIPEVITGSNTLAVDNQYTRVILEGGIFGFIIWLSMIVSWFYHVLKPLTKIQVFFIAAFYCSFFVMGLGYEVFQVSKSATIFWFVLGVQYSINKRDYNNLRVQ